jgi:anaphase-promoting complex subunit 3
MAYEKISHFETAYSQYNNACNIAPHSALARYRRARILIRLKQYHKALQEFLDLEKDVPNEVNIQYMLGKLYKVLNMRSEAFKDTSFA